MAYVAKGLEHFINKKVGDGSDVEFVYYAANAPPSSVWRRGSKVQDQISIASGTAIATFSNDHFVNMLNGGWAAIYISQDALGIRVLAQEEGHPVHEETIPWHASAGDSNTGDKFFVIE